MKEHQHIEWKEAWRDEHLKWISGFANAEGGALVINRNDKGMAVGVPDARKLLVDLPNKVRDLLGIMVDVNLRTGAGREYLEIAVPPYPNPISFRGECITTAAAAPTRRSRVRRWIAFCCASRAVIGMARRCRASV